ncbi:hypothetical protein B0H67DRAFT_550029 [Lasiosphaeris hirsuta]|uniref:Uncharacterized protein n=1 Tax=Lasiosphaeris hirsuta TaxID=260670 RepID=A0AA40AYB5_9PEZI|nr:hypothetical protein B0H67DRAFT_550029 [Lasiosphaeris hirsuta]
MPVEGSGKFLTKSTKIEVFRKDTSVSIGYIYNSNGPAIGSLSQASSFVYALPAGATSGAALRFSLAGTTSALGWQQVPALVIRYPSSSSQLSSSNLRTAAPYSVPISVGPDTVESDIWAIDTATGAVGWAWIAANGETPTTIWRVGGRLYPVGNLEIFLSATGSSASNRYEVLFKLVTIKTRPRDPHYG